MLRPFLIKTFVEWLCWTLKMSQMYRVGTNQIWWLSLMIFFRSKTGLIIVVADFLELDVFLEMKTIQNHMLAAIEDSAVHATFHKGRAWLVLLSRNRLVDLTQYFFHFFGEIGSYLFDNDRVALFWSAITQSGWPLPLSPFLVIQRTQIHWLFFVADCHWPPCQCNRD